VHDPVDLLTAALILLPAEEVSRNRHPDLHAGPTGAAARRRAARIRSALRQLQGADGPARAIAAARNGATVQVRYEIGRLSLRRQAELPLADVAVLRVALADRAGIRLLPPAMKVTEEDRTLVDLLVAAFRARQSAPS